MVDDLEFMLFSVVGRSLALLCGAYELLLSCTTMFYHAEECCGTMVQTDISSIKTETGNFPNTDEGNDIK